MFRSSLIAAAGLVALAAAASAQPLPTTKLIAGYIVSADASARTIQVKTGIDTQTYTLAEDAKLEAGKAAIQTADLTSATGQRTTIWYTIDGDTRVASRVKLAENKDKATATVTSPAATATTPQ
jgi:hypothetical protein